MPNANDAELTRLFTAHTTSTVEDDAPNTPPPGGTAPTNFDLIVEAAAGNVLGSSGSPYHLLIRAIDETDEARTPTMDPPGEPTLGFAQNFISPTWNPSGTTEFVTRQTFNIPVPSGVKGHRFHYTASLVTDNDEVVSAIQSNEFVLV